MLKFGGLALGASMIGGTASAARPNARFDLDFSTQSDADENTASSPGWVVDRRAPGSWTAANGRLTIEIADTGPTSGFYAYQGKKYQDADGEYWYASAQARFSYDFYIDPSWETDNIKQETGVWPVLGNSNGDISAYPILAYQDSDASETDEAKFRAYVYESDGDGNFVNDKWVDVPLSKKLNVDPEDGGWVSIEAQLHPVSNGSALKWRINNKLVADERGYNVFAPSTQFLEFIVNSVNFGETQTYEYDNMRLTESGSAGK